MPVPFRYRKLGYVALNVTDIARTTEFATRTFVLENTGTGPSGEQFLSCGPEHHDVVLYQSKEPGFLRGAWELESPEDVERAHAHYEALGLKPVWLAQEEKDILALGAWPGFCGPGADGRALFRVLLEDDVSRARASSFGHQLSAHRPLWRERAERPRG